MVAPEGMMEMGEGFGEKDWLWRSWKKYKGTKVENDTGLMFGCGRMGRRQVLLAFGPVARGQWYKRPWEKWLVFSNMSYLVPVWLMVPDSLVPILQRAESPCGESHSLRQGCFVWGGEAASLGNLPPGGWGVEGPGLPWALSSTQLPLSPAPGPPSSGSWFQGPVVIVKESRTRRALKSLR